VHLLLDTHAFLWWLAGDAQLSRRARAAITSTDNIVHVSAASSWEIATKFRLGKLPGVTSIVDDIAGAVASQAFVALSITLVHAQAAGVLPLHHRDPFDRMLIAQAHAESLSLVSNEEIFDQYAVRRVW
jgi:PIN domain nuclease of toxin-antitoxin system